MPEGTDAQQDVYTVKITIKGLDGVDHDYIQGVSLIR